MSFSAGLGGALGGAGAGATFGPVGAGIGGALGLMSGLMGSAAEEQKRRMQMEMRAQDQLAAPYLAKAGVHQELTPYEMGKNHGGDVLEGALNGLSSWQGSEKADKENKLREAMYQKLLGNNPGLAGQQSNALSGMKLSGVNDDALMQLLAQQGTA